VPIAPRARAHYSESPWSRGTYGLPEDLQDKARARTRWMALLFGALALLALALALFNMLSGETIGTPRGAQLGVIFHGIGFALSVMLFAVARSPRIGDGKALLFVLSWEIAICAAISIGEPWISFEERALVPRITWVALIVVSVPLIVPAPPRRVLLVSVIAAATAPAGLLGLDLAGVVTVTRADLLSSLVSPTFAVVVAYFGSKVLYGMSRDVAAARKLGAYELDEQIGQGGMGEVWRARHRMLARPAAIKLVRRELPGSGIGSSSATVRRFEREAQVTATLRSPHTVELYDFGVSNEGLLYYVMELLDGLDLETLVREHGAQPAERVVQLLVQICHSLDEAHDSGLVHRDIKPANIFICRHGRELDFVKVLDFGLVALQPTFGVDSTTLTAEGKVQGTPAYMAPELAVNPEQVDGRADIYALGCVAFYLLTGRVVFPGDSAIKVIADHVKTPPPSLCSIAGATLPPQLDALVVACLAKDPADRPQSAAELVERLRALAIPPWDAHLCADWWEQHVPKGGNGFPVAAPGSTTRSMPRTVSPTMPALH